MNLKYFQLFDNVELYVGPLKIEVKINFSISDNRFTNRPLWLYSNDAFEFLVEIKKLFEKYKTNKKATGVVYFRGIRISLDYYRSGMLWLSIISDFSTDSCKKYTFSAGQSVNYDDYEKFLLKTREGIELYKELIPTI